MSDSKQDIMEATYLALQKHGYSDLSIQKIADESEKGKSLIYYHFDDKQDLMESFLDYILEKFREELEDGTDREPEERLEFIVEKMLGCEDKQMWEFRKAMMEIKAQTPHREVFADKFSEMDSFLRAEFTEIFRETGFDDAEKRAELFLSAIEGGIDRKIVSDSQEKLGEYRKDLIQHFLDR